MSTVIFKNISYITKTTTSHLKMIEHKNGTTYGVGNPVPGLGQETVWHG